jgi:hypothetical protein
MSTRLTKLMRQEIVDRIIEKTFAARIKKLKAAQIDLADAVYEAVIPVEFVKVAKKNPEDWFNRFGSIDLYQEEGRYGSAMSFPLADRKGISERIQLSSPKPFPASYGGSTPDVKITGDILALAKSHISEEQKLCDEREILHDRLIALVRAVSTLEKLRETAPELTDYLPEPQGKSSLPMIPVGALVTDLMQAGLKIPAEKTAA